MKSSAETTALIAEIDKEIKKQQGGKCWLPHSIQKRIINKERKTHPV